jgi:hypothetical protein
MMTARGGMGADASYPNWGWTLPELGGWHAPSEAFAA